MMYSHFLAFAGLVSHASAACSREMLQNVTQAYLGAQRMGMPAMLPLAKSSSYAENDMPTNVTAGVISQALVIDHTMSFYDTSACIAFTEITSATSKHPYVIHTETTVTDGKITNMESFVTDAGDWSFNATAHLYWNQQETWSMIPKDKQDTRAVIKAAGDAYLDNWANVSLPVPEGTPCARLEGGSYTGEKNMTADTCTMGAFPVPVNITRRRYAIDEEYGVVGILENFPWLDVNKPDGIPSSNLIRVEGGKIRYIHEVTVCATPGTPGCGR